MNEESRPDPSWGPMTLDDGQHDCLPKSEEASPGEIESEDRFQTTHPTPILDPSKILRSASQSVGAETSSNGFLVPFLFTVPLALTSPLLPHHFAELFLQGPGRCRLRDKISISVLYSPACD